MDLLYVYDDKIACDRDGNYYTGSAFSQEIFDRYLAQFDTLTLLMRRAPVSPDDMQTLARMNRLTDARIRVVFYPDRRESLRAFLSLQRRREIRQIITRSITPERAVIIRVPSESGTIAARFLPPDRKAVSGRGRRLPVGQPDAPQSARKGTCAGRMAAYALVYAPRTVCGVCDECVFAAPVSHARDLGRCFGRGACAGRCRRAGAPAGKDPHAFRQACSGHGCGGERGL